MKETRVRRVLGLIFLLFMLACLWPCNVPPEEERMARSNELDEVVGEVELVVPAERNHHGVCLSPDNRKLLVNLGNRVSLLDLVSDLEKEPDLECEVDILEWLDDDLLLHSIF